MDHGYALAAGTIQTPPRKRQRSDEKRERDRVRQKNRVNIGVAYSRWKALKAEKGLRNDAEVACYLLDRVCGEHLSQDKPSKSLKKKERQRTSTAAPEPQTEVTLRYSPEPSPDRRSESESQHSPDPQTANVEVLGICHDLPPLQPHQLDEAQPEQQTKEESDLDFMIGSIAPPCGFVPQSSSSSTTEDDNIMYWDEIKDELAETAQCLEERLDAMKSFSVGALAEPISKMRAQADQRDVKWVINKSSLTGLFRTCHQCGEPVLESKTLTSGSLVRIQWECSNGHLMWLFPNHNPT